MDSAWFFMLILKLKFLLQFVHIGLSEMVTTWTADVQLIVTTWTVDVQLIVTTWTADSADGNYMFLNIPDLILNIRIKCDRPMNEPTKQHANRTSQLLNTIGSDIYIYISLW